MPKTRQALDDAVNGSLDKFYEDEVARATLAAMRAIAADVDEVNERLGRQSKLVTGAAVGIGVQILIAVIIAALRL